MATPGLTAAEWRRLSPKEREELAGLTETVYGGEGLRQFLARVAPHEPPPPHLGPIIDLFERARRGRVRVCLSIPPRHGKTITIKRAIAWWLTLFPSDTCAYLSYSDGKARSESGKARDIAVAAGIQIGQTDRIDEWRTEEGGGVIAAGLGGGITGKGVQGLMIVDDPYSDSQDANSPAYRALLMERFGEVVYTRLEGASVIVVHTRWRQDDLIGWLTSEEQGWEYINLPALAEPGDRLGRKDGEALWPEQYPTDELASIRKVLGEFSFAALYQGQPRPRGAKVFHRPARFYDPVRLDLTGASIVIGADPAATDKTTSDFSTGVVQAIWRGRTPAEARSKILDVYRRQVTIPQFARDMRAMQQRWPGAILAVEAVGAFAAVPQLLRESAPGLVLRELSTKAELHGDKFQRAQGFAAAWNDTDPDDRVLLPQGAPWIEDYLAELYRFTGVRDAKDDQVDGTAHGWNTIVGGPAPAQYVKPGRVLMPRRI